MNKRTDDVGMNMRPEVPAGILVGLLVSIWEIALNGPSWQAFGLFIIVAVLVEWVGSIFLQRNHDITKQDIYIQAQMLREKIRGFDDED